MPKNERLFPWEGDVHLAAGTRRLVQLLALLLGATLGLPAAVHASTSVTITLEASASSLFRDEMLFLTATTSPPVDKSSSSRSIPSPPASPCHSPSRRAPAAS